MAERKYQMIRVAAGDYLLPSNDLTMLWRIYSYEEDGSAGYESSDGYKEIVGKFWACARYDRPLKDTTTLNDQEILEWEYWITWDTLLHSRREAIDAALKFSARGASTR